MNVNEAWKKLFEKYNIENKILNEGFYFITANQIKEFKEPRLMAKFDSSESLPPILKKTKINILPVSRSEYVLSDFKLYEKIPQLSEQVAEMKQIEVPNFESIDVKNITTESNDINVLLLSGIINDFLEVDDGDGYFSTFNGRMGTGEFHYVVDRHIGKPLKLKVNRAQCEIDAGLENKKSIVIIEAKNVIYPDFHIRQLYFPYRLWKNKVTKPIRLVFSVYSNQIYRLFEYRFSELENYSSVELVKFKNYSLQDTNITYNDLLSVYKKTHVITDDNMDTKENKIPFIQADSFERVISLLEILSNEDKTKDEISEEMQFDERQSDYYFNAGKYLGLFCKEKNSSGKIIMRATNLGKSINKMNYKEKQLKLVSLIFEHKIFHDLFFQAYSCGKLPEKSQVMKLMKKYNVCESCDTIKRRAASVISWIRWIMSLPKINGK